MADRFIVINPELIPGVELFEDEESANSAAADSAHPRVVLPATVPDDSHHALYDDIHRWAQETDDPNGRKGAKYSDRYDTPGRAFEDHRSIPREVVDAYHNDQGKNAEDSQEKSRGSGRRTVKVTE